MKLQQTYCRKHMFQTSPFPPLPMVIQVSYALQFQMPAHILFLSLHLRKRRGHLVLLLEVYLSILLSQYQLLSIAALY
ncbi:hypothetical protein M5689_006047 [Euphorbia peplus]|nr:hypothetical protein M5689_006047 [Euphorbia peplus]